LSNNRLMHLAMMVVYRSPLAPVIEGFSDGSGEAPERKAALEELLDTQWDEIWHKYLSALVAEEVGVEPTDAVRDELRSMVLMVAKNAVGAGAGSDDQPPPAASAGGASGDASSDDLIECRRCGKKNQSLYAYCLGCGDDLHAPSTQ
jgi:hypothetical protein